MRDGYRSGDSFAARRPYLAALAIIGFIAFAGASLLVTLALKAKIYAQVERSQISHPKAHGKK